MHPCVTKGRKGGYPFCYILPLCNNDTAVWRMNCEQRLKACNDVDVYLSFIFLSSLYFYGFLTIWKLWVKNQPPLLFSILHKDSITTVIDKYDMLTTDDS